MDLLLKMQNLLILVNEKLYISTLVWSRGMIFSQCLENNKKICSEIENFHFSTIKNPSAIFKKKTSDIS